MMFVRVCGRGIDLHLLLCCSVTELKALLTDQLNKNTLKKMQEIRCVPGPCCVIALPRRHRGTNTPIRADPSP